MHSVTFSLALLISLALFVSTDGVPVAQGDEEPGLRNSLQYLQDLNRYYMQMAKPRPERERREDVASALMKLSQIRQHYSDVGRPRFGKRTYGSFEEENYVPVRF